MTEAEWTSGTDPLTMLRLLPGKAGDRKSRLFACACCRRVWPLATDPRTRRWVEVAERAADGRAGDGHLSAALGEALAVTTDVPADPTAAWDWPPPDRSVAEAMAGAAVENALSAARHAAYHAGRGAGLDVAYRVHGRPPAAGSADRTYDAARAAEMSAQCKLLRDVFGDRLRPGGIDPAWRTSAAVGLARAMYEAGDFAAMPILADALEEAGCDDADILAHCRGDGPHVRGCWVVDLVLGNE